MSIQNKIDECKQKIKNLQEELLYLEFQRDNETIAKHISPGDNIFIFSDNLQKHAYISEQIFNKYSTKIIKKVIYILESNRGGCKYTMRESYLDELDEIENLIEEKMRYEQNWKFRFKHIQKSIYCKQLLKYLVKNHNLHSSTIFDDKIVYHDGYNEFSYNTLHKIEIPIICILDEDNREDIEDIDVFDVNVLTYIGDADYYKMEYNICRG